MAVYVNWYFKCLKQYADFKGRSRRREFWLFSLISFLVSMGILILLLAVSKEAASIGGAIYSMLVTLPSFAVAVRRMHDVGKSGWFALIPIYSLVLAVQDSQRGRNEYGPYPKG